MSEGDACRSDSLPGSWDHGCRDTKSELFKVHVRCSLINKEPQRRLRRGYRDHLPVSCDSWRRAQVKVARCAALPRFQPKGLNLIQGILVLYCCSPVNSTPCVLLGWAWIPDPPESTES